ncbi:MAG: TolC family protein [Rhodoferax sp.]
MTNSITHQCVLGVALLGLSGTCCAQAGAGEPEFDGSLIGAVRMTLEREPTVAISRQQVVLAEAQLLLAQSAFDPVLYTSVGRDHGRAVISGGTTSASSSDLTTDVTSYQAGLSQKLRSGITVNPLVTVTHTRDNGLSTNAPSNAKAALNFSIPLMRGSGEEVATTEERASAHGRDAARHLQNHAISAAITKTVLAYWDYQYASRSVDILLNAERQVKDQLEVAKRLGANDEIPLSEVRKYESRLRNQAGSRIGAEQSLIESRNSLGMAMGYPGSRVASLKAPADGFELVGETGLAPDEAGDLVDQMMAKVQERRADLLAQESRLSAARVQLVAATDTQKPKVDLVLGLGYSGFNEYRQDPAALSALISNVRGPNASATLNYSWPVNKRSSEALIMQRLADVHSAELARQSLLDNIQAAIALQFSAVAHTAAQLKQVRAEVAIQQEVFHSENRKYRYGLTTLLDLFTSESQLLEAQLREIAAQRNLAQALIRLRFESGTLLEHDSARQSLDSARLVSLPRPGSVNLSPP